MKDSLKVAVAGIGTGTHHAANAFHHPDTELAALCHIEDDLTETRLAELRENIDDDEGYQRVAHYSDFRDMIDDAGLDIVVVATPHGFHAEQAVYALEQGTHVLVEKPMAVTLTECQAMIKAVEASGRKLAVDHSARIGSRHIREMIDRGELGQIYYAESNYIHPWRLEKGTHNSHHPFLAGGIHGIDLVRWIVGDEVAEVNAYGNNITSQDDPACSFDDFCFLSMKFDNGAIGLSYQSTACKRPGHQTLIAYGTKGTIVPEGLFYLPDSPENYTNMFTDKTFESREKISRPPTDPEKKAFGHSFMQILEDLVLAIRNDGTPLTDVRDGANSIAVCLAGIDSIETGKPIKPERF